MIEIFDTTSEVSGIKTFNLSLKKFFELNGLSCEINIGGDPAFSQVNDVFIYSRASSVGKLRHGKKIFIVHGLHNEDFLTPKDVVWDEIWCFSEVSYKHLKNLGYKKKLIM